MAEAAELSAAKLELPKLKAALRRVQEERIILNKPPRTLQRTPSKVRVHPRPSSRASGRGHVPGSAGQPQRLLRVAEASALDAVDRGPAFAGPDHDVPHCGDGVYGSPRVFRDLREDAETCGRHRVARIMKAGRL